MAKAPTAEKLIGPLALTKQAWLMMWRGKWSLWAIIAVVAMPVSAISLLSGGSNDVLNSYSQIANFFMYLAVLWALMRLAEGKANVSLREAYYRGTQNIVRFLLIVGLLILMWFPFLIGALIYIYGAAGSPPAGLDVKLLLGLVWLLLSWPAAYWLTRSIFAAFELDDFNQGPIAAVHLSSANVRGRGGKVFGRLMWLVAILILLGILKLVAVLTFLSGAGAAYVLAVIQFLVGFPLIPFTLAYLLCLYQDLKARPATTKGA